MPSSDILLGLKPSIKGRSSCQSQECCRAGTGSVDLGYEGISSATSQRYAGELIHCHHNQSRSPGQQRGECSRESLTGFTRHSLVNSPFHLPLLPALTPRQRCKSHPPKAGWLLPKGKDRSWTELLLGFPQCNSLGFHERIWCGLRVSH